MKKLAIILVGLFLMTIAVESVQGQATSASATSNATATIITPIALTNTQPLAFGNIAASTTAGTVTIATAGTRSSLGGVTPSAIGVFNNAIFTVEGQGDATYAIALPASTTISNGTETMTVDNFISDPSSTGLLSSLGAQTMNVGATLNVGISQAVGNYTGTYSVTVSYN
nr:DUF4402 domain-containing protein [Bacteroidota bacterium]